MSDYSKFIQLASESKPSWKVWDGRDPLDVETVLVTSKYLKELRAKEAKLKNLEKAINSPSISNFLESVRLEALHQINRWGSAEDRAKNSTDWFWLIGYLAGKALQANKLNDKDKELHHCISTAAALYNWHASVSGEKVDMSPGRADLAKMVEENA